MFEHIERFVGQCGREFQHQGRECSLSPTRIGRGGPLAIQRVVHPIGPERRHPAAAGREWAWKSRSSESGSRRIVNNSLFPKVYTH
jgi:hypothetical protein